MTQPLSDQDYRMQLNAIHDGKLWKIIDQLQTVTHPRLKYPLEVLAYNESGTLTPLSVNPAHYSDTTYVVAEKPSTDDLTLYRNGYFGYNLKDDFRRIGPVNYVGVNADGNIREVGLGSELLIRHFCYHIHGRELTEQDWDRIAEIQTNMFEALRTNPPCQEQLEHFVQSRQWPDGMADKAHLGYYSDRCIDLRQIAQERGYTDEEMLEAGWFELNFNKSGEGSYSIRDAHVVRIPYYRNGRIEVWRTRNLRASRSESHKYTSWPVDRSITMPHVLEHKLYNGWRLPEARGRRLIITEGEFKCLITTELSGILTVGIPGITEVDDATIQALVQARASEYILILDRDPYGKGLRRVDGVTDSQRAAYFIASRLKMAGARNVKIGIIPNVRDGGKVGLDDLILDRGVKALWSILRNASTSSSEYAQRIKLDTTFCHIQFAYLSIRKAVGNYLNSVRRGGATVPQELEERAVRISEEITQLYRDFLAQRFDGARRLNQPKSRFNVQYRRKQDLIDSERRIILTEDHQTLPLRRFMDDILMLDFLTQDVPSDLVWALNPNLRLYFTSRELQAYAKTGATLNPRLQAAFERGLEALEREDSGTHPQNLSVYEVTRIVVAGILAGWFPTDEHFFKENVALCVNHDHYWEEITKVPLMIFRKGSNDAVVFADCAMWEERDDLACALDVASQRFNLITWFFRDPSADHASRKFTMIMDTLWPYWYERNLPLTQKVMKRLGIDPETVGRYRLLALQPEDMLELGNQLVHKRLLNQSAYTGLFHRDTRGRVIFRFKGTVVLLPITDAAGAIVALRVLPVDLEDHIPPSVPPLPKIVSPLFGTGRYLISRFAPKRHLYLQENLQQLSGKSLILTFHELDALSLAPANEPVIALNSSFELAEETVVQLRTSNPEKICVVVSGPPPTSHYDLFCFDQIPGYLKDLWDLQRKLRALPLPGQPPLSIYAMASERPLNQIVQAETAQQYTAQIREGSIKLDDYLTKHGFNSDTHKVVQRFLELSTRLLHYLEIISLPDVLDKRPVEWYVRQCERLYTAVQAFAQARHRSNMMSLDEYFMTRLGLPSVIPLEELVRRRKEEGEAFIYRPVYRHDQDPEHAQATELPQSFLDHYQAVTSSIGQQGEVLIVNSLALPTQSRKGVSIVVTTTNPKVLVLEFLQAHHKHPPTPQVGHTKTDEGFNCLVSVEFQGRSLKGTGQGPSKKVAEQSAYHSIWTELNNSQEPTASVEESEPEFQTAVPTTLIDGLKMDAGDTDYVSCLHRGVQISELKEPQFRTSEKEGSKPLVFITTVTLTLADGTQLTSAGKEGRSKKESRQAAASDLITKIWEHSSQ